MELVKEISKIPLFNGLSGPHLEELAMIVTTQQYQKGQTIFSEGEEGVGFYVILAGRVKIT